jgi:hypothetical protein
MKRFFTWIVIFYSHSVWCQNPYRLTDASVTHRLLNHLSYQIDSSNRPFREVISQNFVPLSQINISSKKNVAYWVKAEVRNETGFDQFILTTDQWGSAIVWVKEGSEWKSTVSGTTIPVERRPTSLHRILSFPVKISPGETKTIYIRVQYTQRWLGYFVKLYSFLSKVELDEASHAYQKYSVIQVLVAFVLTANGLPLSFQATSLSMVLLLPIATGLRRITY